MRPTSDARAGAHGATGTPDRSSRWWALVPAVLLVAGAWAVLTLPCAPGVPAPADLRPWDLGLGPAAVVAAEAYAGPRRAWALVGWVVRLAVPLLWVALPAGRRVLRRLAGRRDRAAWRAGLVAVVVLGTADVLLLPVNVWLGHVREVALGLRTAGLAAWLRDWAVGLGLDLLTTGVAVAVVAAVVARRPRTWRWPVLAAGAVVVVLGTAVWPLVVTPLFLDTRSLDDGPVRDRVEAVVAEAEQRLGRELGELDVRVVDASRRTTRRNAVVTGVGPTLRVHLFDTLAPGELADDEARAALRSARARAGDGRGADAAVDDLALTEVIVAHELAHAAGRDTRRAAALGAAALVPAVLVLDLLLRSRRAHRLVDARGPADPRLAALAAAAFVVLQAVATPVALAVSRQVESAADQFALDVGADPDAQAALHRSFVRRDLAPPTRPAWSTLLFASHPSPAERIARAEGHVTGSS